jgi:hypothetical protein
VVTEYYPIAIYIADDKKPEALKKFFTGSATNLEKLIGWYGSGEHAVGTNQT